jgi:coenzyme F420-dependent glucose-6-phosphate dehydrogenase
MNTVKFGWHPVSDFIPPQDVLEEVTFAENAGFEGIFFSDHFHPWSEAPATPFAWTLLASTAERTHTLKLGTAVTCPSLRYNPAVVAQAFATLGAIYEGRIFLGLGSGESLNEIPVGVSWPQRASERIDRMAEAAKVIRSLWDGDYVNFKGKYFTLRHAKLFTKPRKPVPIYVSAFGPKVAGVAGNCGDGLITVDPLIIDYQGGGFDELIRSFEQGATDAGRDPIKMERICDYVISYDEDPEKAIHSCRAIAGAMIPALFKYGESDPREFSRTAQMVDKDMIRQMVSTNADELISKIERVASRGFTWIEFSSHSPDNSKVIKLFQTKILPYLKGS